MSVKVDHVIKPICVVAEQKKHEGDVMWSIESIHPDRRAHAVFSHISCDELEQIHT